MRLALPLLLACTLWTAACCCTQPEEPPRCGPAADRVLAVGGETIVIGRGAQHGVKRGAQFVVARDGEYVAILQVVDVQACRAAARVLPVLVEGDVRAGDAITNDLESAPRPPPEEPVSSWDCAMPGRPPLPYVVAADDEANVFVISVGREDGVERGQQFVIARGDTYVATLRIDEVDRRVSAGRSLRILQKSPIQRGDQLHKAD